MVRAVALSDLLGKGLMCSRHDGPIITARTVSLSLAKESGIYA